MIDVIFVFCVILLYHPVTSIFRVYVRRKYIADLHKYRNRYIYMYCIKNGKEDDLFRLEDDTYYHFDTWIKHHNIDYYKYKYTMYYSSISNPLVPGHGCYTSHGIPPYLLAIHILGKYKKLTGVDFGIYTDTVVDKDFKYEKKKQYNRKLQQ